MFRQAPSFPYHDLGIVEDGNTASRAISKDAYVIWKGESYFASTDILQGATLEEDVNLTAIPDGVINGVVSALNNKIKQAQYTGTSTAGGSINLPDEYLTRKILAVTIQNAPGGYFCVPFIYNNRQAVRILDYTTQITIVSNTQLTLNLTYIE